ncbi:coiled-coil domain-containing protein 3-like [Mobula hypostoma]|uniref:coiled-coil domain-containing protein 3-like n=1 Tax=Mobula hypostoma TaxID=723540 RepID=UPI002FC2BCB8
MRWLHILVVLTVLRESWGCQLPHDWRPQSEPCRAELAEIILYAKVLAIYKDTYSVHNYLPWQYDTDLFYSAEVELLCDQAWGSMLEMPAGARFNLTGLGYFPCHSYTVVENNTYYFFVRLDESYNIVPHGINFQDPIFPDTAENNQMFASLFQFSNCTSGAHHHIYSAEWDLQEDNRLLCSTVQKALYEEEDRVRKLSQKVRSLEKSNNHLREKVKRIKRSLRQVKKESKREAMLMKQFLQKQQNKERGELNAKQDTGKPILKKSVEKPVNHKL